MIEVETTADGAIRVLTLNRALANALNVDGVKQIKEIIGEGPRR
jgi:enoyl-CoA hydratase/carnithine racemase